MGCCSMASLAPRSTPPAADQDQAALVFNVAAQMIRNDPDLAARCEILDSRKRIVHRPSGSVYRAISAEAYTKHGLNAVSSDL